MIKYAKIINEETKQCEVGVGTNKDFYQSIGMTEMEVEEAYNGQWFLKGYAPLKPEPTDEEQRQARANAYLQEVDPLHSRKQRKIILGEWTEDDEREYILKVKELSDKIVKEYPYETKNNET